MINFVWIFFLVFVLGLIIGSFLNCVIYRLRIKRTFWRGRSFCPACRHQLAWYDNIPLLSFLLLKGRCRYCGNKISWQYFIVEISTAIIFVAVFVVHFGLRDFYDWSSFNTLNLLILLRDWLFAGILILIFVYDLRYYLILDKVSLPAIAVALMLNLAVALVAGQPMMFFSILGHYLLSALLAGGFFLLQFIVSHGKWIGGGDIRLGFLMGVMLGWPYILVALTLGYILGSLVGIALIVAGKKRINSAVPLGTFLSFTTLVTLLWGPQIINWYFNLNLWFV